MKTKKMCWEICCPKINDKPEKAFFKKVFSIFLVFILILVVCSQTTHAQNNAKTKALTTSWIAKGDPFGTNVFVENLGQFNNWSPATDSIKYVINKDEKVFFTKQGLTIKLNKIKKMSEKEHEKIEHQAASEEGNDPMTEYYYVYMHWEGCNTNATISVSGQTECYYTFGEKGYENIKAKGYRKLVYKDLYPGIDVEYTISEKAGFKYCLIVHPGADIGKVKMQYSGDIDKIKTNNEGNILIKTDAGIITDHAPQSYYKGSRTAVSSSFKLTGKLVEFNLPIGFDNTDTLVIDPWITVPTSLNNDALDVGYDDAGNTFASGGNVPYKLSKFNASGTLLWTFTDFSIWANDLYYSRFCTIPTSGSTFIGEGFNVNGPRVMKINSAGTLIHTTPSLANNREIWVMFYNRCTGNMVGFGGGVNSSYNMQVISDTNLTSSSASNFNSFTNYNNDVAAVEEDFNGDFYALMSTITNPTENGLIIKSLISSNYSPPQAWQVQTGDASQEVYNYGIPGLSNGQTVRANSLAINTNYVLSYDGMTINAYNKTNGALLGSVIVNAGYANGSYRTHEGIAINECNTVYAGGTNTVHVYSFNGSVFTPGTNITTNIPNEVYDVELDKATGILYISGLGFVSVMPEPSNCIVSQLNVIASPTPGACTGSAIATVTGGTAPYTYLWSNGATTPGINNVSAGTYSVTVTDHSCIRLTGIDSVTVNASFIITAGPDTAICAGNPVQLIATGGTSYTWSPAGSLSSASIANPVATPATTTTYHVTVTNGTCNMPDSVVVTISPLPNVTVTNITICSGQQDSLTASGATNYVWSGGGNTPTITVNPTTTTTYTVTGYSAGCSSTGSGVVTVNPLPVITFSQVSPAACNLNNGSATATGGATYLWSNSQSVAVITGLAPGVYTVTVTTSAGCSGTSSVIINSISPPTVSTTFTNENCGHANGTIQATYVNTTAPVTFLWSNGQTTQNLTNLAAGIYTVTLTDSSGCTATSQDTLINIPGPSVAITGIYNEMCSTGNGGATCAASGGTPPYSYQWSSNPVQNTPGLTNVHANTYTITVTDANQCTAINTVVINNTSPPTVTVSATPEMCNQSDGTATAFASGGTGIYHYMWSNGQTTPTATGLVQGSYSVTVTDSACFTVNTINIIEIPGPIAGFSEHPRIVTLMDGTVSFVNNSSNNVVSWNWNFGDGSPDGSGSSPSHPYTNLGTYVVTLIVTDNNGCTDTITDTVKVEDLYTFYIPNSFTPNGDGINDVFTPRGLSVDPNNYNEYIFDRWGNIVFHTTIWTGTSAEPWNGTKNNKGSNDDVVLDVYVYSIKVKEIAGPTHVYYGKIALIP